MSVHPAYCNFDERGRQQVGFDLAMALPPLCIKCGADTQDTREIAVKVQRNAIEELVQRASATGSESGGGGELRAGKFQLRLPHCGECTARFQSAKTLLLALTFAPLVLLGLAVGLAQLSGALGAIVLLVALAVFFFARPLAMGRFNTTRVLPNALDSDGFIVLRGVSGEAGEAIVAASQPGNPASAG